MNESNKINFFIDLVCNDEEFACNNSCISLSKRCDGVPDCSDPDDESESICEGRKPKSPSPTTSSSMFYFIFIFSYLHLYTVMEGI